MDCQDESKAIKSDIYFHEKNKRIFLNNSRNFIVHILDLNCTLKWSFLNFSVTHIINWKLNGKDLSKNWYQILCYYYNKYLQWGHLNKLFIIKIIISIRV